jgi:aminopeptidase-like protein
MLSENTALASGNVMYGWAKDLFPINRSLTGEGTLETLNYLKNLMPNLEIKSVSSGTQVFDWVVPDSWNITQGYIKDLHGNSLIDFQNNNLHVMGYSTPVSGIFTKKELSKQVHYLPEQPTAIPYVTSYYVDNWGFCMSLNQWENLGDGPFEILIESKKEIGELNYAEVVIPGTSTQEILFSTYVCHPSMANNELSGPVVLTKLIQELQKLPSRHYTYRAIFVPETIGSLVFLSRNLDHLKVNLIAGWVMTCLGDDGKLSYIPSRLGNTYADRITLELLHSQEDAFIEYSWLDRGSDERQFCAPGVDLPVCSITKTKYGEYPEYHTSLDNLDFISPLGLSQSLKFYLEIIELLEENRTPRIKTKGEPQLGKRNLYPNTSVKNKQRTGELLDIISYLDGQHNLVQIAKKLNITKEEVLSVIKTLESNNLIF